MSAAGLETRRTTNSHRPGKEYVFSYCPLQFERETVVEPLPGIQAPRSNFKGLIILANNDWHVQNNRPKHRTRDSYTIYPDYFAGQQKRFEAHISKPVLFAPEEMYQFEQKKLF